MAGITGIDNTSPALRERPKPPANAKEPRSIPVWDGREYPRYEPGIRLVRCIGFQGPEWVFTYRRWSIRLEFALTDEEGAVSTFLNLGNDRDAPRSGRHSLYAKAWCMANRSEPCRGERMVPDVFVGKFFRVQISDCETRTGEVYSKVTQILSFEGP